MAACSSLMDLPIGILSMICEKLVDIEDRIRLGAVSLEWREIHQTCRESILPQPPVLLFPSLLLNAIVSSATIKHCIYNNQLPLKNTSDRYVGSNHGWLIAVSGRKIQLVNPFLSVNNSIRLPTLPKKIRVSQGVLSHNPTRTSDYVAIIIHSTVNRNVRVFSSFSYVKSGGESWNPVFVGWDLEGGIYYNGRFYAICKGLGLVFCDLTSSTQNPRVEILYRLPSYRAPNWIEGESLSMILVESRGELLCVVRELKSNLISEIIRSLYCLYAEEDVDVYTTIGFQIFKFLKLNVISNMICEFFSFPIRIFFKLELFHYYWTTGFQIFKFQTENNNWVDLHSLEGQAIFVGRTSSVSLPASDFPECEPNRVYFHSPSSYLGLVQAKAGMFNLEDSSVVTVRCPQKGDPIWVQPTVDVSSDPELPYMNDPSVLSERILDKLARWLKMSLLVFMAGIMLVLLEIWVLCVLIYES